MKSLKLVRDIQYEVMLTIAAPWDSHEEGVEEQVAAAVRHHLTKAAVRVATVEAHRPHRRIAVICYRCNQSHPR
jgi:hypothetical protein